MILACALVSDPKGGPLGFMGTQGDFRHDERNEFAVPLTTYKLHRGHKLLAWEIAEQ